MTFPLRQVLAELPAFTLADLGPADPAMPQRWQGLLDAGAARVVGCEASAETCARLAAAGSPRHAFLPLAIADGTERTLYRTAFAGCTSLYEPNQPFLERLWNMSEPFAVVATERVATRRLDDLEELCEPDCDFLNLDIGGAAFDALAHGTRLLDGVMFLQIKIAFAPMYRGAPMLGEIDGLLRRNGFMVHRYLQSGRAVIDHPAFDGGPGARLNQDLWGEFAYVKDFTRAVLHSPERWVKLAVLAHELYQAHDLAHLAFSHADARDGSDLAPRYLAACEAAAIATAPS